MTEVVLRTRIFDHSGPTIEDVYWERAIDVGFVPGEHDSVQLWDADSSPLAPVQRRWWRHDGRVCIDLVTITNSGSSGSSAMKDGKLQWVPLHMESRKLVELLRGAGWSAS